MIILFYLFETYLQTSTNESKLAALSVTVTKSLLDSSGVSIFNIFINDLFLFANKSVICNYAVDNNLYSANKNIGQVIVISQMALKSQQNGSMITIWY